MSDHQRMKIVPYVFLALVAALGMGAALVGASASDNTCLDLKESQTISFEGVLTQKIFPGPPNYEDVRKGDKPEPTYILQLKKPICVLGDEFINPKKQIDRVQVFPDADDNNKSLWNELRKLVDKIVVVDGNKPFGAHTGHHHAPLLLPITKVTTSAQ